MRLDKLTTKFQEALGRRPEPGARTATTPTSSRPTCWWRCWRRTTARRRLLERAGVNTGRCRPRSTAAIDKLPQVQGGEQVQVGRDLGALLQAAEKEAIKRGDQFIASEMFLLAVADTKTDDRRARCRSTA